MNFDFKYWFMSELWSLWFVVMVYWALFLHLSMSHDDDKTGVMIGKTQFEKNGFRNCKLREILNSALFNIPNFDAEI